MQKRTGRGSPEEICHKRLVLAISSVPRELVDNDFGSFPAVFHTLFSMHGDDGGSRVRLTTHVSRLYFGGCDFRLANSWLRFLAKNSGCGRDYDTQRPGRLARFPPRTTLNVNFAGFLAIREFLHAISASQRSMAVVRSKNTFTSRSHEKQQQTCRNATNDECTRRNGVSA